MKNSKYLLLCYCILAFSFIYAEAIQTEDPAQNNELRDATQWDELKKTDSDTINITTEKCEEILLATRRQYQTVIQRLQQLLPRITTSTTLKSHVEDAIGEISEAMRSSSKNIDQQLENLGEKFLQRLRTVINTAQPVNPGVASDFEHVYQSEIEKTDKLAINIRQFVAEDYNPLNKILPTMQKSLNYHSNHMDEFRKIVKNDLELLLSKMDQEFDQLESTVIGVLNRISKSMTVMKVVYASLKKTGQLPRDWSQPYIMEVLHLGTLMSKTASVVDNEFPLTPDHQEETVRQSEAGQALDTQISTFKMDEERSSEQDDDEEKEDDDLGCVLIFSRTKRKMLKELIATIMKIKSFQSIKEIDHQSFKILQDYRLVFYELHLLLVSKIVDYVNNFIILYKMHMQIMEIENPGMKFKMEAIFDDTTVDHNNTIYGEIQRFLNSNFLTSAKIEDLRQQIEVSIRGAKTLKEIQKKVSKELVTITTTLGKDLEEMKTVIVYVLQEIREGILALKHIKENGNVRGFRFYLNFYDGKADLKQLKKLIMILNMLNMNQMFYRDLAEIVSSDQINVSRSITNMLLSEINQDSMQFDEEVDKSTNIIGVKKIVAKYVINFNKMVRNYSYKVRKSLKRMVTLYVCVHEEFIIMVNRRRIQNTEELENISESADLDEEIGLIRRYLAENMQIDVAEQYGRRFNIDSSNVNQSKAVVKQQMHTLIQAMTTELGQLDLQIENTIDKIIQAARNIEVIKQELEANENFTIQAGQFPNLGLIMSLSDFLQVLSAENNVKKLHSQEVNKTFNIAREQIQKTRANAERGIQESADMGKLKVHIAETATSLRSVLLDVGSDIKENLAEISSNFIKIFETFTSADQELKEQILNADVQMEGISEQLKEYVTDRYANQVLNPFSQILSHSPHNPNIAQSKDIVLASLDETVAKIEQDMELVKNETVVNVVEKLSQGMELMEHLQNRGKLVITEEEASLLAINNNVVSILQGFFSTDSTYNANEMRNSINSARETVTKEYSRAITNIQSMENAADIQSELSNSMQTMTDTYTSLTTNIRSQLQSFATAFIENYESAMSNVLGKDDQSQLIMQDIMNGQITPKQSIYLENTIAFMKTDAFQAASEWVSTLFQSIMQDKTKFNSINEAATHQLGSLHSDIDSAIGNMHETVDSLVDDFKQSSTIIQLIKNGKMDLNEDQINSLSNSFQLIQMLTQESLTISNNNDFSNAKQLIVEEFQNTVKAIEGLDDNAIIHDITAKAVDNYNNIYENLRSATTELFTQKSSEFSAAYIAVKEMADYTGNVDLKNMLAEITTNKETLQPSQQLQELEAFVRSEKFTTSTVVQQLFENQSTVGDIEKLNTLTTEVEAYIGEMEQASTFVQTKFEVATGFLTSIENSNVIQWSPEKITILAETISITEKLSHKDKSEAESSSKSSKPNSETEANTKTSNAVVRSLDQTIQENGAIASNVFSEAQNNILLEFDHAQKLVGEAKDENSIQQTMNISIERFGTIFNDLQNKFKNNVNNSWKAYKNLLLDAKNKVVENTQLKLTLQEISENKEYPATLLDEDFSRFSASITGGIYQSPNMANAMYDKIHSNSNMHLNINERNLEELRSIITDLSQGIVEMESSEAYIQKKFEQGSGILNEIVTGLVQQLNEEQIKILAINEKIGQLLQTTPVSSAEIPTTPVFPAEIPYISETRSMINNELQNTISAIQLTPTEEDIADATTVTIQKTEAMFNDLKNNFEVHVTQKLSDFRENYESTVESQKHGNVQLTEVLQNTINKENTETSGIFGEFQSFKDSTVFTSTTVITDMFQAFQKDNIPPENSKDWNLNFLQTVSLNINEHITKIENIATQVEGTLQQGIEILENIKNGQIIELTEEQVNIISSSNQLEQVLPLKKPAIVHVTEEEFTETEVAIKEEYERTIAALELLTDEGAINELVSTTIENTDSVFSVLKEKVQVEITFTVSTFEEIVTTFETANNSPDTTILRQVNQIFHDETVIQRDESLEQIENYIRSDAYNSPTPVQTLFNNIPQNEELNITERSIQCIKELDIQVTDNIDIMNGVRKNILQNFEKGTEIIKTIQNNVNEEFTNEQVQAVSVCHKLSKIISPKPENSVTDNVPIETISEKYNKAKLEINEVYKKNKKEIELFVDEASIEQVALESVHNSEHIYNSLKRATQNQISENFIKFKKTIETTLVAVQENGNEEMAKILSNLPEYPINGDEAFNKYEFYKNSNSYNSETFVENLYEEMQNNMSQSFNSVQEKQLEQLTLINTTLNEDIDNLQGMSTYTIQNISNSIEILETIQNNSRITLTEEQIQTLALSNTLSTTPSVPPAITEDNKTTPSVPPATIEENTPPSLVPSTVEENNSGWSLFGLFSSDQQEINLTETKEKIQNEYSKPVELLKIEENTPPSLVPSTAEENNSGWSLFGLLSSDQPEINLTETKEKIQNEYSKTVELLKTLGTEEEEIQPVVANFVDNSNTFYNNVRENIRNKMAGNSQSLLKSYNSIMNLNYEEGNENLQKVMSDLDTKSYQFEATAEYVEFEKSVTSSFFTSVDAIKETFLAIQEENTPAVVNDSITERSIQRLDALHKKTEEYIDEIGKVDTYVHTNFDKVSAILNQVEKKEIVELTEEQIQTLVLGQEIIHNLVPKDTTNVPPLLTESSTQTISEVDITSSIRLLNEELSTSVKAIESATDEDTVQQILTDSVQRYEEVFTTVRTGMQSKISENVSTYEKGYAQMLNAVLESGNSDTVGILQNIDTLQVEKSENLIEFESFVSSDSYKSPRPVEDTYEALKQEDVVSSLINFHEKGRKQLELLNQQLAENINMMQTTTSYVEQKLQAGLNILQSIQGDAAADLTDNQVKELALSHKIVNVVKTTITDTEATVNSNNIEKIIPDNGVIQPTGIDTVTAISTVQEDYEKAINAIRSATEDESIQAVIKDSIQNFDSVYYNVKETVESEIERNITQFSEIRDSLVNGNEEEINNGIRSVLKNISDNQVKWGTDENFKHFEDFVRSKQFKSLTLAEDIYQQIQQNENQFSTNANQRAEEELTLLSTQVTENITMLEQTKEYITQHVGQGAQVLQTAQQNSAYQPAEEEIAELSLSQTIISTLLSVLVVGTETQTNLIGEATEVVSPIPSDEAQINEVSVVINAIQNQKEEAVNQIRALDTEDSIEQVMADTVHNLDATLSEVQQSMDQKINESTRGYEENHQSAIKLIREGSNEQYKRILEEELNFTPDDQYEMFEKYIKNGGLRLPTAEDILNDVEQNGELFTHDMNEKCAVELDIISTQITQNVVELEEMTSYATTNLEKGSAILDLIAANQNTELNEQQIQEVTLSQHIMQVLTTITLTEEQVQVTPPIPEEQVQATQPSLEIDLVNAEQEIDRKLDESIQKINALTDEALIVQVVAENVQESNTVYSSVQEKVRQKIDESSHSFINIFQTAISNIPEESPLKAIFEEIVNHKTEIPTEINAEYQQVQAEINDQRIMSSSAVDQIYSNIRKSETLPDDIKERSIMEVRTLNEEVKKNIGIMKHIDEFVSRNLQESLTVLQDTEGQPMQELTEQQIKSLSIGIVVSETLTTQTQAENSSWKTFLSYAAVVIPSAEEEEQPTTQNSSYSITDVENHSTRLELGEDIVQVTKSITTTTEVQEKILNTVEIYEEETRQCVTKNNVTSAKGKIRNFGPISVDLLVAGDTNSLSTCQHLQWNTDILSPEDKQTVEEIREYLLTVRNFISTSIPYQQSRINLYQNTNDILVVFVNTIELINEVLQQLSYVMLEKIVLLMTPILQQIENSNIQRELENTSSNLNAEFIDSFKLFSSLLLYEETNILNLVDEQFTNAQCTSLAISKEIILRKFSILNEMIEKILSRIVCINLMIIDLIINGKMPLQTNVRSPEVIKNIQLLYDIISQINS